MKAVVHAGDGRVEVREVAEPTLVDPTDALVRVRRSAVCGTDLHLLAHPRDLPDGFIVGHEYAGEVVAVGSAVTGHRVGDRVAGADFTSCGRCWWCRRGSHWECEHRQFFGTGSAYGPPLPGSQAECTRVPYADTVLCPLPADVGWDTAVFLGDTLATGFAAVVRARLSPGDTVAVVGGGPVGQLTSLVAQACGAGAVLLVEPVAARRNLAAEQGAVAAAPEGARALLDRLTERRGADAVIDAVGGATGLGAALELVRKRGAVVSVGIHADRTWPLPVARAFADELTLSFAIGDLARDADALLGLLRAGSLDPTVLAAEPVPLAEAAQAYAAMQQRRTLKSLITV